MNKPILFVALILCLPVGLFAHCDFVAISAGGSHSLGLGSDGTVWAWGQNGAGQLGNNDTVAQSSPVCVHGPGDIGYLEDVIAIAAGSGFSLALKSDSTVWAWGQNNDGFLGDGTIINQHTPVQVLDSNGVDYLDDIVAIEAYGSASFAVRSNGTLWAWGDNSPYGQLGLGDTISRLYPTQVLGPGGSGYLTNVVKVATSGHHTIALLGDGTAWAWGLNTYGRLGIGNIWGDYKTAPIQVKGPGGVGYLNFVVDIAARGWNSYAVRADGSAYGWGTNVHGQVGDGTKDNGSTTGIRSPVQVMNWDSIGHLEDVVAIEAGEQFAVALKSDGTIWAWGYNSYGKLGNGGGGDSYLPVQVLTSEDSGQFTDGSAISTAYVHTLALKSDGTAWGWGWNKDYLLGNGTGGEWGDAARIAVEVACPYMGPQATVIAPTAHIVSACAYLGVKWLIEAPNGINNTTIEVWDGNSLYEWGDAELTYTPFTINTGELLFIPSTPWDYYDTVRVCLTTVKDSTEPTPLALWDSVCVTFYTDLVPPVLISRYPDSAETIENEIYGMIFEYFDSGCGINSSDWELIINEDTLYPGNDGIMATEDTLFVNLFSAGVWLNSPGDNFIEFTIRDDPDTCGPNEKTYSWWFVCNYEGIDEAELPEDFGLSVWPNPFNGAVTISLSCHSRESGNPCDMVAVEIYDINGRMVYAPSLSVSLPRGEGGNSFSLWEKVAEGRMRAFIWQPDESISSGVYLVRAKFGDQTVTKKVVYLK